MPGIAAEWWVRGKFIG